MYLVYLIIKLNYCHKYHCNTFYFRKILLYVSAINVHMYTVKPVHKGHSREHENVTFISSCRLYTG